MKKFGYKQPRRICFKNTPAKIISLTVFVIAFSNSCQQEEIDLSIVNYSEDIYELKTYKIERHPPVVRNGFGMDIYHEGHSGFDTLYFSDELPAWHPNNCIETGITYYREYDDMIAFEYDLLFYNEFAYSQNYNGDYNGTGYPVIFMYTDPGNIDNSTKAVMVGQGVSCFESFIYDSITNYKGGLAADFLICLAGYRIELHTETVDGTIIMRDDIAPVYEQLVIGNKFRPNIGGVFEMDDASDEAQIDLQPVFLVRSREGLYAKFMVTRFKGTGTDTQKLTLQWQALKENDK